MNPAKSYLLSIAPKLNTVALKITYDPDRQLSLVKDERGSAPLAINEMLVPTQSKTKAEPSDDDPDPDDEVLY